jgi:hypothetical protein
VVGWLGYGATRCARESERGASVCGAIVPTERSTGSRELAGHLPCDDREQHKKCNVRLTGLNGCEFD